MVRSDWRFRFGLFAVGLIAGMGSSLFANTYTWNSSVTDWTVGTSWNLPDGTHGTPGSSDTAVFDPNGSAAGTTVVSPYISGSQTIQSLILAPNQNLGGWTFSGANGASLTILGGLTTYGPATYTFNNLSLGSTALTVNVGSSSTLAAIGISADSIRQGTINVNGGTMQLDYTNSLPSSSQGSAKVTVTGGGTLAFLGNSSASTINMGTLNFASSSSLALGGVNTFQITPNGAAAVVNFDNSGKNFSTRPGLAAVYVFQATSGNLGDANGAQVTFNGTPNLGTNSLLAASSSAGFGYAIVKDAGGVDFATWNSTNGVVRALPTLTTASVSDLQNGTTASRMQFDPSTSQTALGQITNGSLRITPTAANLNLTLNGNGLTTNALMLDGSNSFSILNGSGASTFGGSSGSRYIYVNNAGTTLSTDMIVASSTNNTVFAGPGFVYLTGSGSQNSLGGANRFVIAGGVVRGDNTQIGFTSSGAGVISLTGGVLEIKGGGNGTGTSADFTRPLTTSSPAAGTVTWGGGQTTYEIGGGGFSAYGTAASVNINGSASPTMLQWNALNFVGDGFALKFGSTQSNAVLNFLNPIQLDNGTSYELREINVTAGTGGDKTVMQGVISGASNADLVKTGTGILEFAAANSYSGTTLIQGGTLVVDNINTGTGSYMVGSGSTLRGTGTIPGSSGANGAIYVNSGGTLAPGGLTNTGILTVNNGVTFTDSTSNFNVRANGAMVGNGTSTSGYDQLAVTTGTVKLNNATLNLSVGYTPNLNSDVLAIITTTSSVIGNFNGLATNGSQFTAGGVNWAVYYNVNATNTGTGSDVVIVPVPVPEPGHILWAISLATVAVYTIRKKWCRNRALAAA